MKGMKQNNSCPQEQSQPMHVAQSEFIGLGSSDDPINKASRFDRQRVVFNRSLGRQHPLFFKNENISIIS